MTQRTPTLWKINPDKLDGVTYSSATTTYSSSSTAYSSADVAEDTYGKSPAAWTKLTKTASTWSRNPSANTNVYVYDSATILYDSTRTYDGIVSGEDASNDKNLTSWGTL